MSVSPDKWISVWQTLPVYGKTYSGRSRETRIIYRDEKKSIEKDFWGFRDIMHGECKCSEECRIYNILHDMPLEEVPLHINDPGLRPYVAWRLDHGE